MRRTREKIASDYERRAKALRQQDHRSVAVKMSTDVRKLLSTARALKGIAGSMNVFDNAVMLTVASDLERHADHLIGQRRIDATQENPL